MNADRLREAANRLDSESATYWDGARQEFVPIKSRQDDATAALLRAVADAARQQGTDAVWWPLIESGIWADALALATSILGGEQ